MALLCYSFVVRARRNYSDEAEYNSSFTHSISLLLFGICALRSADASEDFVVVLINSAPSLIKALTSTSFPDGFKASHLEYQGKRYLRNPLKHMF